MKPCLTVIAMLAVSAVTAAMVSAALAQMPDVSAKALVEQARGAIRVDPERTRALAEKALDALKAKPDVDLEVEAQWLLCDYEAERDRAAARRHLEAARALLPRASRPALASQLLACEGSLSELAGDTESALALYERALAVAQTAHDDQATADALFQRGYLRGVRGELASGMTDLRRANDIYERMGLWEQASNALDAVAILYNRLGDYEQARRYFEQALGAQRSAGLLREQAVTEHNLGRALERLGDWAGARKAFDAVLEISGQIAYARGQAYGLRGLASVSNAQGRPDEALKLLTRASAIQANVPDERLRAQIALQRGIALRLARRPAESVPAFKEALRVFEHADAQIEAASTHGELAASLAALGDYKAAYEQENLHKDKSDRLLRRQIEERFATLKVEFDTAAVDRQNQLLKREKAATEHALAQERRAGLMRAVALVLAAALAAALALLAWRHRRASRHMQGLAMTDELTRLPNRRHVLGSLQSILLRAQPCALLIADLDLFKAVNDRHGHLVGDQILRAVSQVLSQSLPAGAQLGRLGGEEFIVLLPGFRIEDAMRAAEQARSATAALDVSPWLHDRAITISIGVTVCTLADDLSSALRRADEALYEAKRSGRNVTRSKAPEVGPAQRSVRDEREGLRRADADLHAAARIERTRQLGTP